jgi:hypothetical protein
MSHEALQSKGEIMKKKIAVLVLGIVSPAATSFAGSTNPVVAAGKCTQPKTSQTTPLIRPTTRH